MIRKFFSIVLMIVISAFFITGCQSQAGSKLTKALAKQVGINSYNASTNVTFKYTVDDPTTADDPSEALFNDIFSNVSLNLNETMDREKSKLKIDGNAKLNGITGNFELYQKDSNIWAKYPLFSKFIQIDLAKADGLANSDEFVKLKNKISQLSNEFMSKYLMDSKFLLKNVKDNGIKSVRTAKGTYNASEIEVTMDNKEFFEFVKYSVNQLFDSADFENFLIEVVKETDGESAVDEQFKKDLKKYLQYEKEEFNRQFENPDDINFSIVFKFYIDSSNNIVRETANFVSKIEEEKNVYRNYFYDYPEKVKVVRNITLEIVRDISDIDRPVSFTYPVFDSDNTISFDKYFEDYSERVSFKRMIESRLEQQRRALESRIYLDSHYNYAEIRGRYTEVSNKYVKNGTTYLPARTMAEALAVDIQGDGSKVVFSGDGKTLVMYVNSKKALLNGKAVANSYPTEVDHGNTMVPAKFVAQIFGAKVTLEYNTMVIQPKE